jgi:hypothetical protein
MNRLSTYAMREADPEIPEVQLSKEEEAARWLLEKLAKKKKKKKVKQLSMP